MSHIAGAVVCNACGAKMVEPNGWVMLANRSNSQRSLDFCPCVGAVLFDLIADCAGRPEAVERRARELLAHRAKKDSKGRRAFARHWWEDFDLPADVARKVEAAKKAEAAAHKAVDAWREESWDD